MKRAAADFGERIGEGAMVQVADDQLLQNGQHKQQDEENERSVHYRPDQSLLFVPFAEMEHLSYAHEFRANQSLHCSKTERSEGDAVRLKDRSFQVGEGGEADIKICGEDQELP